MTTTKYDLKGWTEIADYLNVDETTAKKWFRLCSMPARQPRKRGLVLASSSELDKWMESRGARKPEVKTT